MPKKNSKGRSRNEKQSMSTECNQSDHKAMKPRTRSSSTLDTITEGYNSPRETVQIVQENKNSAKRKAVKRKIQFDDKTPIKEASNNKPEGELQIASNNNAMPDESCSSGLGKRKEQCRKRTYAITNEKVIDTNAIVGDGVDVELHPNADQSDFDSEESEYDDETDCLVQENQVDTLRKGNGQKPDNSATKVINEEDEFDALFENERVQRIFNKMLDKKLEAKLKEHNLSDTSKVLRVGKSSIENTNRIQSKGGSPVV